MAIVKKYKTQVVSINNPIDNIYTVELKSLGGIFKYLPGQFLHLALDEYDPSGAWPESRCFSMQTSPQNNNIKITYTPKGLFTQRMALELHVNKVIDIKLPFGELFQQDHNKEKVVFIAGGTGITPYLSVFTDPIFIEYLNPKLYFGVREKKYNIYKEELGLALNINKRLQIIEKHQNIDGILNIDQIFEENGLDATYFISGPQNMISIFKIGLLSKKVSESNIKTDDWE